MHIKISVPGSKSISNRVLLLKALSKKDIKIENIVDCQDTKEMLKNLKILEKKSPDQIKINTGDAGTATRFLTAYCAIVNKNIILDGSKRMRLRPIKPLTEALKTLGANISDTSDFLPLNFNPSVLCGSTINIDGSISSQFLSALLMICPFIEGKTEIIIKNKLCSIPYIKMTIKLMEQFGLKISNENFEKFTINGNQSPTPPKNFKIEADASSASYIGAYSALNPGMNVLLKNINSSSIQGDIVFLKILEKMGCEISKNNEGTTITGPKKLKSLGEIDMNSSPDLVMTFAILSIFTEGTTKIKNISNLRIKECDRLEALETELKKIGIKVETGKDWIAIQGNPKLKIPHQVKIKTYSDHRIAMCFGLLTCHFPNIKILSPECVNKSYPSFWEDLNKLKANAK
ncbi:3-phosphoshikimate 1-carboxyvinyltransferase [Candidatus Peregrinibacteria bacterium]|nr:3-phosphoshikimate 1-carboxyvinyltransferase [Candidatus Peregrinibacteria bacterium]